jgi:hypothetical protein
VPVFTDEVSFGKPLPNLTAEEHGAEFDPFVTT